MKKKLIYLVLIGLASSMAVAQSQPSDTKGIMWTGDDEIANAMVWRGINHLLNVEREKAYTFFEAAVKQDPSLFAPQVPLSWMSRGEKRAHHKMQAQKMVENKNEASKLYVSLLDTGGGAEGAKKRRAIWKKMHEVAPEGPFIHHRYATSLQDPKAQIAELHKLIAANDKNKRNSDYVHNILGYAYYAEGDKEKALKHYKKYLELRPDGYNSYDSMADFYRREGKLEDALMYYKKALQKYPAATSATNRVREIEAMLSVKGVQQNLPEVFSAIAIKIKEGHTAPEITNNARALNQGLKKHGKGIGYWVSYGDRGERAGKLSVGFTFDFKENRDYYFPKADDNSPGANPQFEALSQKLMDAGISFGQSLSEEESGYTDYVCVGFDDLVDPQLGGLVAVRPLQVKAGSEGAFEKFVTSDLYPEFARHLPGVRAYVFKGDRGEGKGGYILLWSFDTVDRRNAYFPSSDGDASEDFMKENAKLTPVNDRMAEFLSEEMTAASYTDYITIDVGN